MTNPKRVLAAVFLTLLPVSAHAERVNTQDLVRVFASCAGRLQAQMQHQWLISDPTADRTEAHRAAMIDLLDAVLPEGAGRDALMHRSAARQAHAALLTRATFNQNPRDAAWAQRRVEMEISQCQALVVQ